MRVHELAKELHLTSKALLARLKALKIDVKSHASALSPKDVERVRRERPVSAVAGKTAQAAKAEAKVATVAKPKKAVRTSPPQAPPARVAPRATRGAPRTIPSRV